MNDMDVLKLADEIIAGRRLSREEDLSFFIEADLDALKTADSARNPPSTIRIVQNTDCFHLMRFLNRQRLIRRQGWTGFR